MADNQLCTRGQRFGVFRRHNTKLDKLEYKTMRFQCGKKDCPVCNERRRNRLILRLKRCQFPEIVAMWTVTTDPKLLSRSEALESLNHRWKRVHRNIARIYPDFKYFRVIEFTKSGLPHMHILTSCFIPWDIFQKYLIAEDFGKVLQFVKIPLHTGLNYITKYISKGLYGSSVPEWYKGRMWAVSQSFLPQITYGDGQGEWDLFWIDRRDYRARSFMAALIIHDMDLPSAPS